MKIIMYICLFSALACNSDKSEQSDNTNSSNETSSQSEVKTKKCDDMDSYDYGYAVARDQDGLLADCNYLYDIAITQKNISSKSCFCEGVSAYRNNK